MTPREYSQMTPIQKDDFVAALSAKHVIAVRKELDSLGMMEQHAKVKEAGCYNRSHLESQMINERVEAELASMGLAHPAKENMADLAPFNTPEELATAYATRFNATHEEHEHFTAEQVLDCVAERIMRPALKVKHGLSINSRETLIIPFFGYVAN